MVEQHHILTETFKIKWRKECIWIDSAKIIIIKEDKGLWTKHNLIQNNHCPRIIKDKGDIAIEIVIMVIKITEI